MPDNICGTKGPVLEDEVGPVRDTPVSAQMSVKYALSGLHSRATVSNGEGTP